MHSLPPSILHFLVTVNKEHICSLFVTWVQNPASATSAFAYSLHTHLHLYICCLKYPHIPHTLHMPLACRQVLNVLLQIYCEFTGLGKPNAKPWLPNWVVIPLHIDFDQHNASTCWISPLLSIMVKWPIWDEFEVCEALCSNKVIGGWHI